MGSAQKRIGIFGNFGIGNFGNDATLESMLIFLRQTQPDADLMCICTVPEKVVLDHRIPAVPFFSSDLSLLRKLKHWSYSLRVVRKLDMLIIPGTGILNDFCVLPWQLPYALFRWCLAARLCGVKIALVSVGAGPLHHPLSRWFIKHVALMAKYRSYRNKFSKEFLERLGVDTSSDLIYPDIVFSLPSSRFPARRGLAAKRFTVCVGAMAYYGWRAQADHGIYEVYLGKIAEFVLWLLRHDFYVRLIMGQEGDQKAIDDVRSMVLENAPSLSDELLIATPAHSSHEVIDQIAGADVVVSSRFHHLVFAFLLGKPTISIGYAEYHAELMTEMGMGAFCQHSERINVESLISQLLEVMLNKSHYETIVQSAVTAAQERLAQQERLFTSQFLEA